MPDDFTQQPPTPPSDDAGLVARAYYAINLALWNLLLEAQALLDECERERPKVVAPRGRPDSYYGDLPWIWLTYLVSRYPVSPLFGENGGVADDDPSVRLGY